MQIGCSFHQKCLSVQHSLLGNWLKSPYEKEEQNVSEVSRASNTSFFFQYKITRLFKTFYELQYEIWIPVWLIYRLNFFVRFIHNDYQLKIHGNIRPQILANILFLFNIYQAILKWIFILNKSTSLICMRRLQCVDFVISVYLIWQQFQAFAMWQLLILCLVYQVNSKYNLSLLNDFSSFGACCFMHIRIAAN